MTGAVLKSGFKKFLISVQTCLAFSKSISYKKQLQENEKKRLIVYSTFSVRLKVHHGNLGLRKTCWCVVEVAVLFCSSGLKEEAELVEGETCPSTSTHVELSKA